MIEFRNVKKCFNGHKVLEDTSFHIREGEAAGLLGRSGTGKSTILKMVGGVMVPDGGDVRIGSSRVGYIFQEHRLIPWKKALENVSFSLRAWGYPFGEARERAGRALDEIGLKGFKHHYPGQLSGGMCQRVSIARAFAVKPDILLMDEPFSALDATLKEQLMNIVCEMLVNRQSLTVLYVSHNPGEMRRITNRAFMLSQGGTIHELDGDFFKHPMNGEENLSWRHLYKTVPHWKIPGAPMDGSPGYSARE